MNKSQKDFFDIRYHLNADNKKDADTKYAEHVCDFVGCCKAGKFKAPKSPDKLNEYYYFCIDHIRAYNKSWNFFQGKDALYIEEFITRNVTGHRPTWPMGAASGKKKDPLEHFKDPFDFKEDLFGTKEEYSTIPPSNYDNEFDIINACDCLGVVFPPEILKVKSQYKKMVKKYHPDLNPNNQDAENKLKEVVKAYKLLCEYLN